MKTKSTASTQAVNASVEVCCSHKVSQPGFISFIAAQASVYETPAGIKILVPRSSSGTEFATRCNARDSSDFFVI